MGIQLYIICFFVGLVGMALQTVLKLNSIKEKAKVANVAFSVAGYFKDDWLSIAGSILTIILFMFFVDEIIGWNPFVIKYLKFGFAFIGYTGSDILSRAFGVASRKINAAIDIKTDVADGKIVKVS